MNQELHVVDRSMKSYPVKLVTRYAMVVAIALLSPALLLADAKMACPFSDHMVLQRSRHVPVWGFATPGESVAVDLAGVHAETSADQDGGWHVEFDLLETPQGPLQMIVQAKNRITITDILVGEVWLASGQSNMEFALSQTDRAKEDIAASANPMLRQFKVTKADGPMTQETCRGYWDVSSPATAGRFSAVAYYFGLALQRELHVPVGLISSNFGGSNIESWLSPQAVASLPSVAPIAAERIRESTTYPARLQQYRADYAVWQSRYHREGPDTAGPHAIPPVLSDKDATVHLPGDVTGGDPRLANGGSIWLSRTVTVPENAANTYLPVTFGKVSEFEQVFWDGVRFGSTTAEDSNAVISADRTEYGRRYDVPGDRVKSGTATITVHLFNPIGPPSMEGVPRADGVKFDGAWHMRVEATEPPLSAEARATFPTRLPTAPSGRSLPSQLFNTMIHPLIPYAIRGVIWYQGEANVSHGYGYRVEFPALIRDWRAQWKEGEFPFYFCEISNFGPHVTVPRESPEAELRESQSLALALPNTGEAITIDMGEEADIHYRNKQPVGMRLARLALAGTYGKSVQSSGPVFKSMKVEGHAVRIAFLHAEGGLIARPIPATYMPKSSTGKSVPLLRPSPQSQLEGFAICGDDHLWHWANAHLDGDTVIVSSPEVSKPIAVRYAWAENPITNLYNRDGLPAAPFRTDNFPVSTQDRRYGF